MNMKINLYVINVLGFHIWNDQQICKFKFEVSISRSLNEYHIYIILYW